MKKFVLLFAFFFAFAAMKAQLPDFWTGDTDIETFYEGTTVHGGLASCGVIVNSGTQANCDLNNSVVIEVSPGEDYVVSFWAKTSLHVRATCALDWVGASATYSNTYVGPATNGWEKWEYSSTVPDGVTGVKLRIRFYDVAGFAAPETQYVDDVEFQSPVGSVLTVANGNFEAWPSIKPEPSNYPTTFTATPLGLNIALNWTDATGAQLPDSYLILASTQNNFTTPVDGVFVLDDLNLADGSGAANVAFGAQTFSFTGLQGQMMYYFQIYPYTNAGTSINFKTDGTAPSAQAMTANVVVMESQNFDEDWGGWTTVSIVGDQVWDRDLTHGILGTPCAKMSGYASANLPNEDWLISPAMNFDQYNNEVFTFYSACGYPTVPHQIQVKISVEYEGGDPNDANWTTLNPILPSGDPFWVYTYSGELVVSAFTGTNVRVAFVYISDDTGAETWEIDNVVITGEAEIVIVPEPSNYPTAFGAVAAGQNINLSWTDATGTVIPTGYLLLGSTQNNIAAPVDAAPVANDLNFADGTYALNVATGVQAAGIEGLAENQTYYFKIFPYTNAGANIDYKTDGMPPSAQATTETSSYVDVMHVTFNNGWENWTAFSVLGDEIWALDATHGVEGSQCAKMSGYAGASHANEDWLVSPAINLSGFDNEKLSFFTAVGYTGDPLKVKISTDYTGSGNPSTATWTDLSGSAIWPTGTPFWVWTSSGEINISAWGAGNVYIAFVYTSTDLASSTWELDEIKIIGEENNSPLPEPTNYPTSLNCTGSGQNLTLTWVDAVGAVIPTGYLIKASSQAGIPNPVDGTPVADDLDFSDGFAAKNIAPGVQTYTFENLVTGVSYLFTIFPYTNTGANIDYKTTPAAPYIISTVGIEENIKLNNLFVYPNPSTGKLNITTKENFDTFEVYALTGQLLLTREINSNQFQADLSDFNKGIYLIRLINKESGSFISKNIIIN